MRKFTLTVVIAIIALGFYHASTMVDNDIVAKNNQANLTELKKNMSEDVQETVTESAESAQEAVVTTVEDSDISLGLSKSSVSGSVVNRLLFDEDKVESELTVSEVLDSSALDADDILKFEEDGVDSKNRLKIIEIYRESPEIFDVEVLKEYLEGTGYSQEDYLKAICAEIE